MDCIQPLTNGSLKKISLFIKTIEPILSVWNYRRMNHSLNHGYVIFCNMSFISALFSFLSSFDNQAFFNIPIGGRIPDLIQTPANESEDEWQWNDHEQGFSALRHPGMKLYSTGRLVSSNYHLCSLVEYTEHESKLKGPCISVL